MHFYNSVPELTSGITEQSEKGRNAELSLLPPPGIPLNNLHGNSHPNEEGYTSNNNNGNRCSQVPLSPSALFGSSRPFDDHKKQCWSCASYSTNVESLPNSSCQSLLPTNDNYISHRLVNPYTSLDQECSYNRKICNIDNELEFYKAVVVHTSHYRTSSVRANSSLANGLADYGVVDQFDLIPEPRLLPKKSEPFCFTDGTPNGVNFETFPPGLLNDALAICSSLSEALVKPPGGSATVTPLHTFERSLLEDSSPELEWKEHVASLISEPLSYPPGLMSPVSLGLMTPVSLGLPSEIIPVQDSLNDRFHTDLLPGTFGQSYSVESKSPRIDLQGIMEGMSGSSGQHELYMPDEMTPEKDFMKRVLDFRVLPYMIQTADKNVNMSQAPTSPSLSLWSMACHDTGNHDTGSHDIGSPAHHLLPSNGKASQDFISESCTLKTATTQIPEDWDAQIKQLVPNSVPSSVPNSLSRETSPVEGTHTQSVQCGADPFALISKAVLSAGSPQAVTPTSTTSTPHHHDHSLSSGCLSMCLPKFPTMEFERGVIDSMNSHYLETAQLIDHSVHVDYSRAPDALMQLTTTTATPMKRLIVGPTSHDPSVSDSRDVSTFATSCNSRANSICYQSTLDSYPLNNSSGNSRNCLTSFDHEKVRAAASPIAQQLVLTEQQREFSNPLPEILEDFCLAPTATVTNISCPNPDCSCHAFGFSSPLPSQGIPLSHGPITGIPQQGHIPTTSLSHQALNPITSLSHQAHNPVTGISHPESCPRDRFNTVRPFSHSDCRWNSFPPPTLSNNHSTHTFTGFSSEPVFSSVDPTTGNGNLGGHLGRDLGLSKNDGQKYPNLEYKRLLDDLQLNSSSLARPLIDHLEISNRDFPPRETSSLVERQRSSFNDYLLGYRVPFIPHRAVVYPPHHSCCPPRSLAYPLHHGPLQHGPLHHGLLQPGCPPRIPIPTGICASNTNCLRANCSGMGPNEGSFHEQQFNPDSPLSLLLHFIPPAVRSNRDLTCMSPYHDGIPVSYRESADSSPPCFFPTVDRFAIERVAGRNENRNAEIIIENRNQREELVDRVVGLAKSQSGSRFLQRFLSRGSPDDVAFILDEVQNSLNELMVDAYGNYLCQQLFEACNCAQRRLILTQLSPNIVSISCDRRGTHSIQSFITVTNKHGTDVELLLKQLEGDVLRLSVHYHGTHVIQRALSVFDEPSIDVIMEAVIQNLLQFGRNPHGLCVVKKCITAASKEGSRFAIKLLSQLSSVALGLVQSPYGNYAIQHTLETWTNSQCQPIIQLKFSSNVVEKVIEVASSEDVREIIVQLTQPSVMAALVNSSSYANFVVQKALEKATDGEAELLFWSLNQGVQSMQNKRLKSKWDYVIHTISYRLSHLSEECCEATRSSFIQHQTTTRSCDLLLHNMDSISHHLYRDESHVTNNMTVMDNHSNVGVPTMPIVRSSAFQYDSTFQYDGRYRRDANNCGGMGNHIQQGNHIQMGRQLHISNQFAHNGGGQFQHGNAHNTQMMSLCESSYDQFDSSQFTINEERNYLDCQVGPQHMNIMSSSLSERHNDGTIDLRKGDTKKGLICGGDRNNTRGENLDAVTNHDLLQTPLYNGTQTSLYNGNEGVTPENVLINSEMEYKDRQWDNSQLNTQTGDSQNGRGVSLATTIASETQTSSSYNNNSNNNNNNSNKFGNDKIQSVVSNQQYNANQNSRYRYMRNRGRQSQQQNVNEAVGNRQQGKSSNRCCRNTSETDNSNNDNYIS